MSNRFGVQSLRMDTGSFEIVYYDRQNKTEHVAKGFTSLLPKFVFDETMGPALDRLIEVIRTHQPEMAIHVIGDPYPEATILSNPEGESGAEV